MKQLFVILNGICTCSLCISMDCIDMTFVNDSKSVYTIDASELKDASLSCNYCSAIDQIQIHPGRYLHTYFYSDICVDHGNINIKRGENTICILGIKVPEHFRNWEMILDNENWWARFSVKESMQAVIEKQSWHLGRDYFIKIHDYDRRYRYSNQRECLEFWSMKPDGSEDPEPPANGDTRPQVVAPPMEDTIIQRDYLEEKYKFEEGGCCLLL